MDRDKGSSSGGKFGKFLAIGMAISLIWGILLIVVGIYIQSNFSTLVQGMMGKVSDVVKTDAAKNNDQNIVPVDDTIDPNTKWGDWYDQSLAWVLALGVATCLFAVLGFFEGLKHHKTALYLTVVILLITAVLFLIVIIMAADPESSIHSDGQDKLITKLQTDYAIEAKASTATSLFIKAMNAIMLWFQCCGIKGPKDFKNLTFIEIGPNGAETKYTMQVPPACCNRNFFKTDGSSVAAFERLRDCAVKGTETTEQINTKGCYNEVYSKLSSTITAILILILVWDVSEDVSKTLQAIKVVLYGTADQEPATEQVAMLSTEMYQSNTLLLLVQNLARVDFEGRKDAVAIFNNLLRRQFGTQMPTKKYICMNSSLLIDLVRGVHKSLISQLHEGIQCHTCAARFHLSDQEKYRAHMDWHFRQNKLEQDMVQMATNRKWFDSISPTVKILSR